MRLFKSLSRRPPLHEGDFHPDRDWLLLFGSFLVLAIITFAAAGYLYRVLDNLEVISQRRLTVDQNTRLDQVALDRVVAELTTKHIQFEALLTTPPTIIDPAK